MLLEGAVDMHCHFGPEPLVERITHVPHSVDPVEAVREADELGMAALVLKAHEFPSTTTAYLADKAAEDVTVFGGICCDASWSTAA